MIFNTALLEKGLRPIFETAYKATLARPHLQQIRDIMTMLPSNASQEKMAWLGDFPLVQEWIGDRNVGMLNDYDYVIKNKDWIIPVAIHENELADDQMGALAPRVEMMGQAMAQFPMELVAELLINGTTLKAFDGIAFFSDISGVRKFDNLLGGTGVTLAQVKTDIQTARAAMMRFATDKGRKLGIKLDTIVCPPEMEATMLEAVNSTSLVLSGQGANYNPVSGWIKRVISLPELADTNDWYGLSTEYPLRPLIFQERQGVRLQLDDSEVKRNKRLIYQADMRGNAGYGLPHMAVKVVNT
jgi:phage major head subunit gpT-like protein